MKNIVRIATLALLSGPLLLGSCSKDDDDNKLEGPVPQSSFTFQVNTTEFPTVVTFTSTSQDGFLYQYNFLGDNAVASGPVVKRTYTRPGTYEVELITAGKGGTSFSSKQTVTIPDACTNTSFNRLVGCASSGTRVWSFINTPGAIVRETAAGVQISSSAALPACQLDDQFTFSNNFTVNYESGGGTFQNGACGESLNRGGSYIFRPNASGNPQIVLQGKGAFIGLPDSVVNKTYDILDVSDTRLRLRGTNPDGTRTVITLAPFDATAPIRLLLTGGSGSSKTWVLDNAADAPIVVGTEAAPTSYFAGVKPGELPACQSDDDYTFSDAGVLTYDAKAETFSANGFSCQAPQSGTSPFVLGPAAGAGLAQFTLTRSGAFIGTTDASPTERVYRILSIDNNKMTIRAGSGQNGGTVFTIKLVAK